MLLCVHNFVGQRSGNQRLLPAPLVFPLAGVWSSLPELTPPQAAFVFVCLFQSLWPLGTMDLTPVEPELCD